MKLKLTLASPGPSVDLSVTCDASTTVGDIATHLSSADPRRRRPDLAAPGPLTLAVGGSGLTRVLDPGLPLVESGLRSGSLVELRPAPRAGEQDRRPVVGTLVVVEGPDLGREFPLRTGSNVVGRSPSCDVRLSDGLVSREHVRLLVGRTTEVVDLGSANGVQVAGATMTRATLRSGEQARVGDTTFLVRVQRRSSAEVQADSGFVRSPRLVPRHDGTEREAPEVPEPPGSQAFPYLTLLAPLVLGLVLYLVTHQLYTLLFIALSPLMLVGHYVEQRVESRRQRRRQREELQDNLLALAEEVAQEQVVEREVRRAQHPGVDEVVDATRRQSPLLWARRPDRAAFAELRLGSARQPSRSTIRTSAARRGPAALRAAVQDTIETLAQVADVPVAGRLLDGPLGVAGPRALSLAAARAAVVQAAGLHSPDELVICVLAGPGQTDDWDWVKWLPHCGAVASPLTSWFLASTPAQVGGLLAELETLVAQRDPEGQDQRGEDARGTLPVVLLVVEHEALADLARLVSLGERGARAGVVLLWVAEETSQLPAVCATHLAVDDPAQAVVTDTRAGFEVRPVRAELIDATTAEETARRLCPVVDLAAQGEDASDLPRSVALLDLIGQELASSPLAAVQRWNANRSLLTGPHAPADQEPAVGTLRAVVGQAAGDVLALDLRAQGPHALVGGTTGSGKSELLQTWILSMAASHSPERLTVLLVDYKGGAAFAECRDLPHTVGMVTDLDPKGVRRALESLRAELRHREHVLAEHGAKDLMEMERRGVAGTPPSLVIVVDEFAALATEVPEFVDGVVDVAQRGRSLGLHLVLATQRPAGVIKENLRANTNLRLALRMADTDDSQDVLGVPDAAYFDHELPGRAVSKVGPGRLTSFQAAYVGGTTTAGPRDHDIAVQELGFGAGQQWQRDVPAAPGPTTAGESDLRRVVRTLTEASALAELPLPRKPWLHELATHYDLADPDVVTSPRRDSEIVFGVADAPARQAQPMVVFRPDVEGNLAIYGASGSGKSVLLRTIAASLGFVRRGPAHVYGLDFGSRGLAMIEALPHVGSVVVASDEERVRRLLDWLRGCVDERAARYAAARAGTISDYRQRTGETDEPRLVLLLDGLAAFRTAYESDVTSKAWENFLTVATEGRPLGIHVVVTADRPSSVPTALGAAVQRRVVLRMAENDDYALLGVPRDVLDDKSPPGRGVVDGLEVQVALLGRETDTAGQARAMVGLAGAMQAHAVTTPRRVERLPDDVWMSDLPATTGEAMTIGMASDTLGPIGVPSSGSFIITGPSGSGRTTALLAVAAALGRVRPEVTRVTFASRASLLAGQAGLWSHQAVGADDCERLAASLVEGLQRHPERPVAVFVQGLADLVGTMAENTLGDLSKACEEAGGMVVAEGQPSLFNVSYGLAALLKTHRTGIALQPDSGDGYAFGATFPNRLNPVTFPVGRGLLVLRGNPQVVQVMQPGPRPAPRPAGSAPHSTAR